MSGNSLPPTIWLGIICHFRAPLPFSVLNTLSTWFESWEKPTLRIRHIRGKSGSLEENFLVSDCRGVKGPPIAAVSGKAIGTAETKNPGKCFLQRRKP